MTKIDQKGNKSRGYSPIKPKTIREFINFAFFCACFWVVFWGFLKKRQIFGNIRTFLSKSNNIHSCFLKSPEFYQDFDLFWPQKSTFARESGMKVKKRQKDIWISATFFAFFHFLRFFPGKKNWIWDVLGV